MVKKKKITLLKSDNMLVVSPTTARIYDLLAAELTFTETRFLRGKELWEALSEKKSKVEVTEYECFGEDFRGRIACAFGYWKRIKDALTKAGYSVVMKDLTPPENPEIFEPQWDRISDFNLRPGQLDFLVRLLSSRCGRFNCPPGFGKSFLIGLIARLLPLAYIDVVTKRVDVAQKRIFPELCGMLPSVGMVGGGKNRQGFRVQVYTAGSYHRSPGNAHVLVGDECVTGDAVLRTPDGDVRLDGIKAGNKVLAFDGVSARFAQVTKFWSKGIKPVIRLTTVSGRQLECTEDHLVRTVSGWKPAGELRQEDKLVCEENAGKICGTESSSTFQGVCSTRNESLKEIERLQDEKEVFDIEVEGCHNFFANGVLVHNCHELAADSFAVKLAKSSRSRNYGLSATHDMRKDNKDLRLEGIFGPIVYSMSYQQAVKHKLVVQLQVNWRPVSLDYDICEGLVDVEAKRTGLWTNDYRNDLIAEDANSYADDVQVLIVVETIQHAVELKSRLPNFKMVHSVDGMSPKDRETYIEAGLIKPNEPHMTHERKSKLTDLFSRGKLKKAIATSVWNVGVSFNKLQVLIRADGGDSEINDVQIPGRSSRVQGEKSLGVIHDYVDYFNANFKRKSRTRRKHYEKQGWKQNDLQQFDAGTLGELLEADED